MIGLPPDLRLPIRDLLLDTRLFNEDHAIMDLLIDERISRWQYYVPTTAGSPIAFVNRWIRFFYTRDHGRGLLNLLLVIRDELPQDGTYQELSRQIERLERFLKIVKYWEKSQTG